jgi:hypothetical protein
MAVMPLSYTIDKVRRLVCATAEGFSTYADIVAHQKMLSQDPDFDPEFGSLLDLSRVIKFDLNAGEIRSAAEHSLYSKNSRRAILVHSNLGFGLGKSFDIYREILGEKVCRVFRDREDAMKWLLEESADKKAHAGLALRGL